MRDMRKVKNRYVFELDNKQMVFIFIGFIVISLLVFMAGVMVGSKAAKNRIMTVAKKEDIRVQIKAPSLLKEKRLKLEAQENSKIFENDVVYRQLNEKKNGRTLEKKSAVKKEKSPVKTVDEVISANSTTAKNEKSHSKRVSTKSFQRETWFVQVASFPNVDDARTEANRLERLGYKVLVIEAQIPGKGTWHRVRLGPFATLDNAKAQALKVEKKEKISTFVTKGSTS